ncbi:hypothetical protein ACROYT_G022322 [Oculina patagonica]
MKRMYSSRMNVPVGLARSRRCQGVVRDVEVQIPEGSENKHLAMATFNTVLVMFVLCCLVSRGLPMPSVVQRGADKESVSKTFLRHLFKDMAKPKREPCVDLQDQFHCFYLAAVDNACDTQGDLCRWSCSLC